MCGTCTLSQFRPHESTPPTHRHHHGRQRSLGQKALVAAHRGPCAWGRQCATNRQGGQRARREIPHAVCLQFGKLAASGRGSLGAHGFVFAIPRERSRRDESCGHSFARDWRPQRVCAFAAVAHRPSRARHRAQQPVAPDHRRQLRWPVGHLECSTRLANGAPRENAARHGRSSLGRAPEHRWFARPRIAHPHRWRVTHQ